MEKAGKGLRWQLANEEVVAPVTVEKLQEYLLEIFNKIEDEPKFTRPDGLIYKDGDYEVYSIGGGRATTGKGGWEIYCKALVEQGKNMYND